MRENFDVKELEPPHPVVNDDINIEDEETKAEPVINPIRDRPASRVLGHRVEIAEEGPAHDEEGDTRADTLPEDYLPIEADENAPKKRYAGYYG